MNAMLILQKVKCMFNWMRQIMWFYIHAHVLVWYAHLHGCPLKCTNLSGGVNLIIFVCVWLWSLSSHSKKQTRKQTWLHFKRTKAWHFAHCWKVIKMILCARLWCDIFVIWPYLPHFPMGAVHSNAEKTFIYFSFNDIVGMWRNVLVVFLVRLPLLERTSCI